MQNMVKITYKPKLSPLFCDKMSLTMQIPFKDRPFIVDALKDEKAYPSSAYRLNKRLNVNKKGIDSHYADSSGDTTLLIKADPMNPTLNFLRFEWNPGKADTAMLTLTVEHFLPPSMTSSDLMSQATVTRLDLTVDVNIRLDRLLVYSKTKTWSEVIAQSGRTLYLGTEESFGRWCVYDKAAEMKGKNKKKCAELKESIPTTPVTRIELRLKPKMPLSHVSALTNPFADLVIVAYPAEALANPLASQTLRLARHEGMDAALKGLPTAERKKMRAILKPIQVNWWDPQAVWEQVPGVLESLANPHQELYQAA